MLRSLYFYTLLIYNLRICFLQVNAESLEKLETVENICQTGPVKIGIGSEAQETALRKAGCTKVFTVDVLEWSQRSDKHNTKIDFDAFIRAEDTVVMVQPSYLPVKMMRQIAAVGCQFQVPGHDPVRFASDDDRAAWRRQKPRNLVAPLVSDAQGRPPKWPIPTAEQIGGLVADWQSDMKRALVVERMQERVGAPVPMHWCRDQVIKATGSARRKP